MMARSRAGCRQSSRGFAIVAFAVVAALLPRTTAAALAQSDLLLMTLTFTLASDAEAVSLFKDLNCTHIGDAGCTGLGVQQSWQGDVAFGPAEGLEVRLLGAAFAAAPPPTHSLAIGKVFAFVHFANDSEDPTDISVQVGGAYFLLATGDTSHATITVKMSQKDVGTGDVLIPEMLLTEDSVNNDEFTPGDIEDSFEVTVRPFSTTRVTLNVEVGAEAFVPEPSTVLLMGAGLAGALLCARGLGPKSRE
jgi:hypothetical protein